MPLPSSLIRGHVIVVILCGMAALAAVMGLLQLWWTPFSGAIFYKSLVTIGLLGVITGFIAAINIDMATGRARILMLLLMVVTFIGAILGLGQLWWQWLDLALFTKIIVSLLVIAGLLAFFMAAYEDFGTARKLKDDKFID